MTTPPPAPKTVRSAAPPLPILRIDRPTLYRYLRTGTVVLVALILAWIFWWRYLRSPWTRDGRVRVEVVTVASEISGKVIDLAVLDNQIVRKGDILFKIEPIDYRLALAQAKATEASRKADLAVANANALRRRKLGIEAVSAEELNSYNSAAEVALASYQAAVSVRAQAEVNLARTIVRSPVNGYVTNLILRVGDYASPGQGKLTLVDSDSFWVAGYFEETKLPGIHVGDYAHIRLMGWDQEITGHVESFSRAIADNNSANNTEGLADVSPIFTWVRLAQRIPVRIHIDHVPDPVKIAAGQTCTIVLEAKHRSATADPAPRTVPALSASP